MLNEFANVVTCSDRGFLPSEHHFQSVVILSRATASEMGECASIQYKFTSDLTRTALYEYVFSPGCACLVNSPHRSADSFVFKLLYSNETGGSDTTASTSSRRYGFQGVLNQPAVFSVSLSQGRVSSRLTMS